MAISTLVNSTLIISVFVERPDFGPLLVGVSSRVIFVKTSKECDDEWSEYRKETKKKPTHRVEKVREFYKVEKRELEDDRKKRTR